MLAVFEVVATARGDHRLWRTAEEPVEDVDLVSTEVGDRPAREVFVKAPVEKAALEFLIRQILIGPAVTVFEKRFLVGKNFSRNCDIAGGADRAVPVRVGIDDPAADFVALDEFFERVNVAGVAAALVADLAELAGFIHRLHHRTRALKAIGHHFLAIDMLASLQGHDRVRGVPEIRGCHDHGVEILLLLEHVGGVNVAFRVVAEAGADAAIGSAHAVLHDVANGGVAKAGNVHHRIENDFVLFAAADEAHVNHVRRGLGAADRFEDRGCAKHESRTGEHAFMQEASPGHASIIQGGQIFHRLVSSNLLYLE